MRARREPVLLPGTLAVVWLVATTRWGSYAALPGSPLFIADLLLLAGVAVWAVGGLARRLPMPVDAFVVALCAFSLFSIFRALPSQSGLLVTLRDLAPFVYAMAAVVAYWATRSATGETLRRTKNALLVGLVVHASWVTASLLSDARLVDAMPIVPGSPGIHIFEVRSDVDGALVGLLGAYLLWGALLRRPHTLLRLVLVCGAVVVTGLTTSRAALIATVVMYCVATCAGVLATHGTRRKTAILALGVISGVLLLVAATHTNAGQRLVGALSGSGASGSSVVGAQALGTTHAREEVWSAVLHYSAATPTRLAFGVGAGPDFLQASGADVFLEGDYQGVRSPHNYLVGLVARLGLVGLVLWLAIVAIALRRLWRGRVSVASSDTGLLCLLMCVGLTLAAMMGVVLESPFGAVPTYWGLGVSVAIAVGTLRKGNLDGPSLALKSASSAPV